MYKAIYQNASRMADLIQSGEYKKLRKSARDERVQGLIRKPAEMLDSAGQGSEEEDPIEMLSSYISAIRAETPERDSSSGAWDYSNYDDFADRLAQSESSGRSGVQISTRSGGREQTMTGLYQFSEDRLEDYKNQTGASFSVEDFRQDEDLQRDVFAWHMQDIDRVIDQNDFLDEGFDRDGLRAVAHLGGVTGMIRYARSNGEYNPEDEFGTSLSDYYNRFSNS